MAGANFLVWGGGNAAPRSRAKALWAGGPPAPEKTAKKGGNTFFIWGGGNDAPKTGRKAFGAGAPAEGEAKQDLPAESHRFDSDVIGVLDRADETAAIKRDIEFAGQI